MRKIITLAVLTTAGSINADAQWMNWMAYQYSFDDTLRFSMSIDTTDGYHGLWQIGAPHKHVFTSATSSPNVIMTDSMSAYPPSDTSQFSFWHLAQEGYRWPHTVTLSGYYWVDTDTLTDRGTIEWSYDNGQTWADLLYDPTYSQMIFGDLPVLSGRSGGWRYFYVDMWNVVHDVQPFLDAVIHEGDTIRWRFGFESDALDNGGDGLMYDDISFTDLAESVPELSGTTFHSSLWPNPAHNEATLVRETAGLPPMELIVRDATGAMVLRQGPNSDHRTTLDLHGLVPGLYVYELRSTDGQHRSMGRFVEQ